MNLSGRPKHARPSRTAAEKRRSRARIASRMSHIPVIPDDVHRAMQRDRPLTDEQEQRTSEAIAAALKVIRVKLGFEEAA